MAETEQPGPRRRRRWGLWALALVALLVVAVIAIRLTHARKPKGGPKAPTVPVTTETARTGDIGVYLQALGTVTPLKTVNVVSRVVGQIVAIHFTEGQHVHENEPLLEIDPRPYQAALIQAEGQLARDRGLLRQSEIDLQRYREAFARNAIAKQQLDDQEQLVIQNRGLVKADEGVVRAAQINVEYCHLTAPVEGRVGLRLVDVGNVVQANGTSPLLVITQMQPITVIFSIAEDALGDVLTEARAGHPMAVEAYDRSGQHHLATGQFLTADNQVDPTTGTVRLRALFENQDELLFPNQFVNVRLLVRTQKAVTLVPTTAVQRSPKGPFVYRVTPDGTAHMQQVTVGPTQGEVAAVGGVSAGEHVATSGFDRLREGAKVHVQQPQAKGAAE